MRRHLEQNGQVIVFLNRRGFAPTLLCAACGWHAECPACDARMTLHQSPRQLVCHHCALRLQVPDACETCGGGGLIPVTRVNGRLIGNGAPGSTSIQLRDLYREKRAQGWHGTPVDELLATPAPRVAGGD